MASPNTMSVTQLSRLVGTANAPLIIDVRIDDDLSLDPRSLPAAQFRRHNDVAEWAADFAGASVVVVCQRGLKLSEGVAAWLRHSGAQAVTLDGGFEAWAKSGQLMFNLSALPVSTAKAASIWVTRARPKIDRIACPWLIRRFIDPKAVFLFVAASEALAVAERFQATPFDIEGCFWSHRGETCTFDTMLAEFGLRSDALERLAKVVRAADTNHLDAVPEAAGLLAVSLGLSRQYRDDLEQLDATMAVYDGFYLWARDAQDERHDWPQNARKAAPGNAPAERR